MSSQWLRISEKKELYNLEERKKREEYILSKNFDDLSWDMIREYIIYENKRTCKKCKLNKWQGCNIPLEINHIDGDNTNNKKTNLECLCPNCHGLTSNWRGRNKIKKEKISNEKLLEYLLINDWNMRKSLIQAGLTPKGGNYKRCHKIKREYEKLGKVISEINILPKINKEEFVLVFSKFKSDLELSKHLGVSLGVIKKWCKEYNCKRKSRIPNKMVLLDDFKKFKYFTRVGNKYAVSDNTVRKWCLKYNILDEVKN
jgi:hypothetical protein